jgi:hypothetical protein
LVIQPRKIPERLAPAMRPLIGQVAQKVQPTKAAIRDWLQAKLQAGQSGKILPPASANSPLVVQVTLHILRASWIGLDTSRGA